MGIHKINHVLSSIMIIRWMIYFACGLLQLK